MSRRKGTEPDQYAGAFTSYEEIPQRYRLSTYAGQYRGEDTWEEYLQAELVGQRSEKYIRDARRGGSSWRQHMQSRNRHHALATPADANAWAEELLDSDRSFETCYKNYFIRIYRFYDWLKHSHQHPHHYNPLLLAAIEYDASHRLWMYRIDKRPEVVNRE